MQPAIPHPLSFCDPRGRLFTQDSHLLRGIPASNESFCRSLFESELMGDLIERGLFVKSWISKARLDGYPLVVEHEIVPNVSLPHEWCADMLRDAALLHLELLEVLMQKGFSLHDAHPWNILWSGTKPVFIDLGSIVPLDAHRPWGGLADFERFFLNPLQFAAAGQGRLARVSFLDYQGISSQEAPLTRSASSLTNSAKGQIKAALMTVWKKWPSLRPQFKAAMSRLRRHQARPERQHSMVRGLRQQIQSLKLPQALTEWSGYFDESYPAFQPSSTWTQKHHAVYDCLKEVRPTTLIDIGSNSGWYSRLAAQFGSKVVASDADEPCIQALYQQVKKSGEDIQPLVIDVSPNNPLLRTERQSESNPSKRLRSEMVLALALVHHLVFKAHMTFEMILSTLAAFSNEWLVVEFIPPDDFYVKEWMTDYHSWYSLAHFKEVLARHFKEVVEVPSSPSPRVILICRTRLS